MKDTEGKSAADYKARPLSTPPWKPGFLTQIWPTLSVGQDARDGEHRDSPSRLGL